MVSKPNLSLNCNKLTVLLSTVTFFNAVHLSKIAIPNFVMCSGIVISSSLVQLPKALSPMDATFFGNLILVSLLQP